MKRHFLPSLVFLTVVGLLTAQELPKPAATGAGQGKNIPGATVPAPLLEQKAVLQSAKAITSQQYPDAKTVLVAKHARTEYDTNGAYVTVNEEYTKVLTEEGRREARTSTFSFNSFYGGLRLLAGQGVKPHAQVIERTAQEHFKAQ